MKTLVSFTLVVMAAICVPAQTNQDLKWTVAMKVIDENGQTISGAVASVDYGIAPGFLKPGQKDWDKIEGPTDTNGVFVASHSNTRTFTLGIQAGKDGYYTTRIGYGLAPYWNTNPANWNPSITLTLKKIGKPIPMYAKWINSEPPVFKKTGRPPITFTNSIGYDLMAGDWVAPCGKGQVTDLVVTEAFDKKSVSDFEYKLTISFPGAGDGIQEFAVPDVEKGSGLRSPHEAPADGYQPQLVRENFHHPGQAGNSDYDENRNYFFRVRTVLDSNGNVKSALYGKVYGDPGMMNFHYYLNPTPNDRNVEFDPKQNLIKGLGDFRSTELRVTAP